MRATILLLIFLFAMTSHEISAEFAAFLEIFDQIISNMQGPSSGGNGVEKTEYDYDLTGSATCASLAGCKTIKKERGCYGPSGGLQSCGKCFNFDEIHKRNIMRADFYVFDEAFLRNQCGVNTEVKYGCTKQLHHLDDMMNFMLLKGDSVALEYQGAPFKEENIPKFDAMKHYHTKFCGEKCVSYLKMACLRPVIIFKVRGWCLTALSFIEKEIPKLKGPPSYILFLAARVSWKYQNDELLPETSVECDGGPCNWPKYNPVAEFEEKAVLVGAAASAVLLTGNWFQHPRNEFHTDPKANQPDGNNEAYEVPITFGEVGFAVQHSLWLAIYSGRLRITLQSALQAEEPHRSIGYKTLCGKTGKTTADNYEGATGTVYAALCSMFPKHLANGKLPRKLRYRPEIHVRHSLGCVEKTAGMVFVRLGDWSIPNPSFSFMGSKSLPMGGSFSDSRNFTTIEITNEGTVLYPPTVAEILTSQSTQCTGEAGNGPNFKGLFHRTGIRGIGGICNWFPVW